MRLLLAPQSLFELLTWFGAVVVIVTALVGVYSMVDFVFWEGWMQGLPDPSRLFCTDDGPNGRHRHYLVYSMAFIRARKVIRRVSDFWVVWMTPSPTQLL